MTLAAFEEEFSFKFLPDLEISMSAATSCRPLVHTQERHVERKSLFSSAIQSIPDALPSEK